MEITQLIKDLSWPIVALVGMYLLLHKGMLKELFEVIASKIIDLGRTINLIKEESNRMASSVSDFRTTIVDLSIKMDDIIVKINQVKTTTDQVNETVVDIAGNQEDANDSAESETSAISDDNTYTSVMLRWNSFVNTMEASFSNGGDFDRRSIGIMARRLADARYTHRIKTISREDAQCISDLFRRIKAARRNWKSVQDKDNEAKSLINEIGKAEDIIRLQ